MFSRKQQLKGWEVGMPENTDLMIMPNGMRVQKNLVDSKKKIQSAKPVHHVEVARINSLAIKIDIYRIFAH